MAPYSSILALKIPETEEPGEQQSIDHKGLDMTKEKESEVAQSCPTLCDPIDCSPPRSSISGIFQAKVLEWVAISFSRRSSRPRDQTWVSCIAKHTQNYL